MCSNGDCLLITLLLVCKQMREDVITVFARHICPHLVLYLDPSNQKTRDPTSIFIDTSFRNSRQVKDGTQSEQVLFEVQKLNRRSTIPVMTLSLVMTLSTKSRLP